MLGVGRIGRCATKLAFISSPFFPSVLFPPLPLVLGIDSRVAGQRVASGAMRGVAWRGYHPPASWSWTARR